MKTVLALTAVLLWRSPEPLAVELSKWLRAAGFRGIDGLDELELGC